jgi:hypothetical protein
MPTPTLTIPLQPAPVAGDLNLNPSKEIKTQADTQTVLLAKFIEPKKET